MTLQPGQTATLRRVFSASDVADYIALAGYNSVDQEVPEPLIGGMFSYLLGVDLPGNGTNYLKQHSRFLLPAYVDETLLASVEIIRLRPEKNLVDLRTVCLNDIGEIVCDGQALVYVKDVQQ